MSFRVSLLTFLLVFAAFGGLRPNLATTDGHSSTMPNAGSAIIAYWETMLPHSTMPSAIRDLLTPNNAEADGVNPSLPVSAFYGKEENNLNLPVSAFYGKEANNLNLPVSTFYGKEANNLENLNLPVSAFYGKEINNLENLNLPVSAFYGKEANNLENLNMPVSAFYGKEANLNLPVSVFYGKEAKNLNLPVSAFYGKEEKNLNMLVSAFYGKEAKNLNLPVSAFYGKEVKNLNLPVSAFYGQEEKNLNLPVSAFYGKEANNLNLPVSAFYGKEAKNLENPYLPVPAFYGKEANNPNLANFYGKAINGENFYLPVSAFYGKEVKDLNPAIFFGKGTNGPVHVSIMNMADADHHVHEHHHVDGGHDHFDLRNVGFLFLEDALTPGSKVAPYIDPASSPAPLLPRDVADSIPMSAKSFPDILRMFAPVSRAMADSIWYSLELCEHPRPVKGEKRGCVTSIESMVDFAASTLRTSDLRAFSSPSVPVEGRDGSKVYTVLAVRAVTSPGDTMTCHGIPFPYKVFLCHALVPTKVYSVTVESDDAEKEKIDEALVVCHLNTAEFDPIRMPPHVKPGDAPVCHFLNNDDVLWAPAATTLGTQGAAADVVVAAQ